MALQAVSHLRYALESCLNTHHDQEAGVHACNLSPAFGRLRQEDNEIETSLGYEVRLCHIK